MKAILVDDEPLALQFLERLLLELNEINVIGSFTCLNLSKEIDLIKETEIVFLDVEMPEVNGLELAEQILQIKPNMIIIFVTAYNEYAAEAFDLNALDYILKPVDIERLKKTLARIQKSELIDNKKRKTTSKFLRMNLCHDLSFQIDDEDYKHIQWRTTRAKEVFLYLLHNEGQTKRKDKLVDLFWGDLVEDRAYSQLYTVIYHIRKTIRNFGDHFSLKSLHESYILETKNITIDIVEWEEKLKKLDEVSERTINEWEQVMSLYTDHLLIGYEMTWIKTERFRLEKKWIQAAFQIADFYKDTEQIEKAEQWYLKICKFTPEEEIAHFELLKIYKQLGLGLLIDHQYNVLLETSKSQNFIISTEIKDWYKHSKK